MLPTQYLNTIYRILFTLVLFFCGSFIAASALPQNISDSTIENEKELRGAEQTTFLMEIENATDSLQKIGAYYNYGTFLDEQDKFEQAVDQLNIALRIAQGTSNYEVVTKIANYLGGMFWSAGDCETSTNYFEQALKNAEIIEDNNLIAMVKMNLSGNYNSSGNANKAIEYSLAALEIKEKDNKLEGICFDYVTVGEIFQNIGNVDKWKLYIQKAYELKDKEGCAKMTDLVMIYNNLGTISEAETDYPQALAYYDTMMMVSKSVDYFEGMGISLLNSALIYQLSDKPNKALELTTESMQHLGDVPYFTMAVNNVKSELLLELNRYSEALVLATATFNNEELEFYPGLKQTCLSLLYSLNFRLGNYQQAFNWNDTLKVYEYELREDENLKAVEELETKYQTEKKEQQIELLEAENKFRQQEKVAFIASLVAMLLLVVAGTLFFFKKKRENQIHSLVLRQQLLRSQMNPHFLFNALGSIQNFMYKNETKKAAGYLGNFARLTRSILEHSAEEFVSLFDEVEMLRNYIELEKMRLAGKFDYEIVIDENIESEFVNVPPMLLQPFVENAIKHGFKEMKNGGVLSLNIVETNNVICVEIRDNGVGINKSNKNNTHRSMSMEIFEERRKVLSKATNRNIECEITDISDEKSLEHGTKVEVRIPIVNG